MKKYFTRFLYGIFSGIGELIPGVGAQTPAILLGYFDDIIIFLSECLKFGLTLALFCILQRKWSDVTHEFQSLNFRFIIPLLLGVFIAFALFSRLIGVIIDFYPEYLLSVSFGIIAASVFIPIQEMEQKGVRQAIIATAAFVGFFALFGLKEGFLGANMSQNYLYLFGAGFFSAFAGFFPGISVSFALLILGLYGFLVAAIKQITTFQLSTALVLQLVTFGTGLGIGFAVCVKTIEHALKHHKSDMMALIAGLIAASLRVAWPFVDKSSSHDPESMTKVSPFGLSGMQVAQQVLAIVLAFIVLTVFRKVAQRIGTAEHKMT